MAIDPGAQAGPERVDGRRLRHARRRPELLGLAADCVLGHGLADVSLRPLSAAMGLSHRGVLHHFGFREALLAEGVQEVRRREQDRVRLSAEELAADPEALLRAVWERVTAPGHLPFVQLHFELQAAAQRHPDAYGSLDELVTSWIDVIASALGRRGLDAGAARPLATFVYATIRGLQLDLLATGDRARVDAAFEELVRALGSRIGPGPARASA